MCIPVRSLRRRDIKEPEGLRVRELEGLSVMGIECFKFYIKHNSDCRNNLMSKLFRIQYDLF